MTAYFGPVTESSLISRLVPIATSSNPDTAVALDLTYAVCIAAIALVLAATTVKMTYALVIKPREVKQELRRL